jgi:hypothetical protein
MRSHPGRRFILRSCASAGVFAALAGAAWGASSGVFTSTHAGFLNQAGSAWLETQPGLLHPLSLPQGVSLNLGERLSSGWVVAGTQPAPIARELFVMTATNGAMKDLPVPARGPRDGSLVRTEPLPLVAAGRLSGLVWLEGESRQRLAVRSASWDGTRWSESVTVSPPGPGSQLALSAARLGDGSWLLAWSAYDGHADTVLWSRGQGDRWSLPEAIAPSLGVPNITPDVVATPTGALAAWSRLEGDGYRVVVSRFTANRWQTPQAIGPLGSVYPQFVSQQPDKSRLVYRTAQPAAWVLAELDAQGHPGRTAKALAELHPQHADERARPTIEDQPAGIRFRWPASGHVVDAAWKPTR